MSDGRLGAVCIRHLDLEANRLIRGAVCEGEWKLIKIAPMPGKSELFNLEKDPVEKKDAAARSPEVAKDLEGRLLAYLGAGQPFLNPCEICRRLHHQLGRSRRNI